MHSFFQSVIHLTLIHSFIHSFTHSFIHSLSPPPPQTGYKEHILFSYSFFYTISCHRRHYDDDHHHHCNHHQNHHHNHFTIASVVVVVVVVFPYVTLINDTNKTISVALHEYIEAGGPFVECNMKNML